jgi:hypothetical protein
MYMCVLYVYAVRCYEVNIIKHNIFCILMYFIVATHEHIPS